MFHEIAPHKLDIFYAPTEAKPDDYVVAVSSGYVLVKDSEDGIDLPTVSEFKQSEMLRSLSDEANADSLRFLFRIDDRAFFLAASTGCDAFAGDSEESTTPLVLRRIYIRDLRTLKPMWKAYAATLGFRLSEWYKGSQFCGRCGHKNVHSDRERAMVCPSCGNTVYPTISPSVIVLIRNGNKALLTKYAASHSAFRHYALVAGYVESGETPEETVHREVFEEVGLHVKNVTYYKSQPWPLSGALLLGYVCDLDGDETITIDESELSVGEWIAREDMPDRSNDISLTSELMEMFRTGKL